MFTEVVVLAGAAAVLQLFTCSVSVSAKGNVSAGVPTVLATDVHSGYTECGVAAHSGTSFYSLWVCHQSNPTGKQGSWKVSHKHLQHIDKVTSFKGLADAIKQLLPEYQRFALQLFCACIACP